ncbi:hypothetical protein FEM48_Zijuj04G0143000 [Ziziphus jujuba var. spinosa]|uniref:Exoribonuclease phosphorolytic domain-containing protein n=1 Tax=Ziziphus jujuba var. spinosa TaxID=714518 RepID=A0A978VKD1_ZIZJJ|nr:hypothetical protein FEM48_Zijuj04G0143000 [Ziziphus jujuba var. spinosa]
MKIAEARSSDYRLEAVISEGCAGFSQMDEQGSGWVPLMLLPAELGKPNPLQPDKGKVATYVDCSIPRVNVAAGASGDEEPEVDISDEKILQFDTPGIPVIITFTKVGRHCIVDATTEEESQMSLAVSIFVNRKEHVCGLTK